MDSAPAPRSLRTNFAWTLAGNAVFAACQWALLAVIAKLGNAQMVGEYALAVAVTLPIAMLAHMNLRTVVSTDIERKYTFGDYLAVRLAASAVGLAATAVVVTASGYRGKLLLVILTAAVAAGADSFADLYYGLMQRRERMDEVAASMVVRGLLSVLALGAAFWWTRDLLVAVIALAGAKIAVVIAYDHPVGTAGEEREPSGAPNQLCIFRSALPLGIVLMLISLTANLPRYAVEHYLGTRELGAFAAVASFITVGNTVVHALGHSATPRLARLYQGGELRRFRGLVAKLVALMVLLGGAGVAVALIAGEPVLRLLYRPEYAGYSGLLVAVMAAGSATYIAIMVGYAVTSARSFGPQAPLLVAVAASSAGASWLLVPHIGLWGAAAGIGCGGCVQIAGQAAILSRLLARGGAKA